MIPTLEEKILIKGMTLGQWAVVIITALAYLMIFNFIQSSLGLIGALALGFAIVSLPIVIFKGMHSFPDHFVANWFYYHFKRPDIYIPGRDGTDK